MSGNINRVPLGLMSLLDSQTQGQAPATMSETVVGGFDLGALWYNSRGLESLQAVSPAQTSSGQANVGINVPEGELWAVIHASARSYYNEGAATNQAIDLTFFPNQQTGVNSISLASSPTRNLGAGSIGSAFWNWSGGYPLYARAGSRFGAFLSSQLSLSTGSIVEVAVLFYRLRI